MTSLSFVSATRTTEPRKVQPILSPAVFATSIFVIAELMYFMALLSAYHVVKSRAFSDWSPPHDVRLPVIVTAVNTLILMASGFFLLASERSYRHVSTQEKASSFYLQAMVLGFIFVAVQGYEWIKLIQLGFTMSAGLYSATFFLLIGSHGVHALGALLVMLSLWVPIRKKQLPIHNLRAMAIFWFFVVAVWPILFGTVYF